LEKLDFDGFLRKSRCLILLFPVIYNTWRLLLLNELHLVSKSIRGWKMLEIMLANTVICKGGSARVI
jgi:hypothetical protein